MGRSLRVFEREGRVAGWIHYYYLSEDKYLDTCSFCIAEGLGDAIGEFTAFARKRFPGGGPYLGFPGENTQAATALEAGAFTCIE